MATNNNPDWGKEEAAVAKKLQQQLEQIMTMKEAAEWLSQPEQMERFGITVSPIPDTLKSKAYRGELVAVMKGGQYLTNKAALEIVMKTYVPTGGRLAAKVKAARTPGQRREQAAKHLGE